MLSVNNLCVSYPKGDNPKNKQVGIHEITTSFPDKQLTAIIGPSGCGKTTLLRSLNRLLDDVDGAIITGEVLLDGINIYDKKTGVCEVRRRIGYISQTPWVLPMSIYDNVAYGLKINCLCSKKELPMKVTHYLSMTGLWDEVKDKLSDPASRLSIGQKQRLCLARSLAVEPEVILADEPTSALDPINSKLVETYLKELSKDYTVIMVSHILRQTRRMADHVMLMYLGKLVEQAPINEFFNNPKMTETKKYIGGEIS
jgi:phosphate transport system ATP-binding protein